MFGIFSRFLGSRKTEDPFGSPERPPGALRSIGNLLVAILLFPVRVLFYPIELLIRAFRRPGNYDSSYQIEGAAPKGVLASNRILAEEDSVWNRDVAGAADQSSVYVSSQLGES